MRKALIPIVGLAVFLWTTEAWPQTQSQNQTQQQTTKQARLRQHALQDANGDGICDHCGNPVGSGKENPQGKAAKKGNHWGPGDGTGNQGVGPRDGTGYGAQSGQKMGPRDGTGRATNPGTGAGGGQGRRGGRR
jgi:type II secretory pathway pseudopilin PulG